MEKNNSLEKINVVGDRVLVKPRKESERTDSGLYLPPGVREKEKIQYGYIVKIGPGYPIPLPVSIELASLQGRNVPIKPPSGIP